MRAHDAVIHPDIPRFLHFKRINDGWVFDEKAFARILTMIGDVPRPVVRYPSPNHFIDANTRSIITPPSRE